MHAKHLFQTLRSIYTGETSALLGYRVASKDSQAELNKMTAVFPEAVGTAAVHVKCLSLVHDRLSDFMIGSLLSFLACKLE
jgi:hypothetical protein